jgi:hypothetical protein
MRLVNFDVDDIELSGLGTVWDLHSFAEFRGISVDSFSNSAVMQWDLSREPNLDYSGCKLLFLNLRSLQISPRDEDMPPSEDLCVAFAAKVSPEPAEKVVYRTRRHWEQDDRFHLLFHLQSERDIEIESETVELIALP